MLCEILKGVQRVPSLLITEPTHNLEEVNLSKPEVVNGELLHDLNGHLQHMLTELPYILHDSSQATCQYLLQNILFSRKEGGYTGADLG